MKHIKILCSLLAILLILLACKEKNTPSGGISKGDKTEKSWVKAEPTSIYFRGMYAKSKTITITSNTSWNVEVLNTNMDVNIDNYNGRNRGTIKVSVPKLKYDIFASQSCDLIIRTSDGEDWVRVNMVRRDE